MTPPRSRAPQAAIVCGIAFAVVYGLFLFLSGSYFETHREIVPGAGSVAAFSPEQISHIRVVFAVVTAVLTGATFLAWMQPRNFGHLLAVLLAIGELIAGVGALFGGYAVLGVSLLGAGVLSLVFGHYSYRGSRPSWAALVSLCGVLAAAGLFGAPKLRGILDVSLWTTMLVPGLFAVATVALTSLRGQYDEGAPVAAPA
jgi:hypothetical protein